MSKASGMIYASKGKTGPVVRPGQSGFAAVSLEHGHIYVTQQHAFKAAELCLEAQRVAVHVAVRAAE